MTIFYVFFIWNNKFLLYSSFADVQNFFTFPYFDIYRFDVFPYNNLIAFFMFFLSRLMKQVGIWVTNLYMYIENIIFPLPMMFQLTVWKGKVHILYIEVNLYQLFEIIRPQRLLRGKMKVSIIHSLLFLIIVLLIESEGGYLLQRMFHLLNLRLLKNNASI